MALAVGLFGALIGSFLNVVVYRVPRGRSVASPPSACPGCGNRIAAYDNIPVISWLLLRARCRHCSAAISARYPLVELATAGAFVLVALIAGPRLVGAANAAQLIAATLVLVAFLYLASISIALALIDLDVRRLPNAIVLPAYPVAALLLWTASTIAGDGAAVLRSLAGLAILGGLYLLLALVAHGGMGFGDVKLAGVLGLYLGWLGWDALAVGGFAAFLLGGLFGVGMIVLRRAARRTSIPFGPWMLGGAWVGIFFARPLVDGYLSLFGLGGAL